MRLLYSGLVSLLLLIRTLTYYYKPKIKTDKTKQNTSVLFFWSNNNSRWLTYDELFHFLNHILYHLYHDNFRFLKFAEISKYIYYIHQCLTNIIETICAFAIYSVVVLALAFTARKYFNEMYLKIRNKSYISSVVFWIEK